MQKDWSCLLQSNLIHVPEKTQQQELSVYIFNSFTSISRIATPTGNSVDGQKSSNETLQ